MKLQKYENIMQSLFTFCKARWARRKKKQKENHSTKVTKITKTKRQKYRMNIYHLLFILYDNFKIKSRENAFLEKKHLPNCGSYLP